MEHFDLLDGEELVALARLELENNQVAAALVKLKYAKTRQSIPVDVHALLGKAFARLGLFKKAQQEFSIYIERQPDALQERFELGVALRDGGDTAAAITTWSRVLEASPNYPPALFFRSLLLLDENRRDEGVFGLRQLIDTTNPENLYVKRAHDVLNALEGDDKQRTAAYTDSDKAAH